MKKNGKMQELKKKEYEVIPRSLLQHPRLSLQAIGLLCNIISYPEDWDLYKSELYKRFPKNKETSVRNAFNELVEEKYIIEIREREGKKWNFNYYYAKEPFTDDEIRTIYKEHEIETITGQQQSNLGTGFSRLENEVPKLKSPKSSSNKLQTKKNTKKQITNKNNINLSINKKVLNLNISDSLKKLLEKQIDRLIKNNFDFEEIEIHYNSIREQNLLSEHEYNHMILSAIKNTKKEISNTINYLEQCVTTHIKKQSERGIQKAKRFPHVKQEKLPKWLNSKQQSIVTEQNQSEENVNNSNENFAEKKLKFESMLAAHMEKKKLLKV
ncbi:hypothetical protein [Bacillus sp. FJAT-45350]|uniref:hypothetical protein n=1 Tax=Bacillus sp. FJAT-45350 TaxID=2011014 RepID=UPI000BB685E4|nr:hypothetical protein [Bacillus sp. FJAT-45350]